MARSQYQYTAIVGPVWRAAVAASLAWLPAGNAQPVRTLPRAAAPPRTVGVAQVYDPAGLGWYVPGARPQRSVPRSAQNWTVLAPFQPAAGFDPATFPTVYIVAPRAPERRLVGESVEPFVEAIDTARELSWLAYRSPVRPPERRSVGDNVAPFQAALYQPAGLQWLSYAPQPQRSLSASRPSSSLLDPFPIAAPTFDAAHLAWLPRGAAPLQSLPRASAPPRTVGVAQIYDPASLEWVGAPARPNIALPAARQSWSLLSPFPIVSAGFDPALLSWLPAGRSTGPRALPPGRWDYTEIVAGLYDPAGLDWFVGSARPLQTLPRVVPTWSLLSPFPLPPVTFDPALFPRSYPAVPGRPERRLLGDSVEPFFAALYRPEGLQWQPAEWNKPSRQLQHSAPTWSLLDPFPLPTVFDAALVPYNVTPSWRVLARALQGDSVEPFFVAQYVPANLQWAPVVAWPLRTLPAIRTGAHFLDPYPLPPPLPPPGAYLRFFYDP